MPLRLNGFAARSYRHSLSPAGCYPGDSLRRRHACCLEASGGLSCWAVSCHDPATGVVAARRGRHQQWRATLTTSGRLAGCQPVKHAKQVELGRRNAVPRGQPPLCCIRREGGASVGGLQGVIWRSLHWITCRVGLAVALWVASCPFPGTAAALPWAPSDASHPWLVSLFEKYHPFALYGAAAALCMLGGWLLFSLVKAVLKWRKGADKRPTPSNALVTKGYTSVSEALKQLYFQTVSPIEQHVGFGALYSPRLSAGDFNSKPSILLLGQYSTGKTTFLKHLLQRDYPGISIGPEPTTDRFIVVGHGEQDSRVPGNTVAITSTKPYQGLLTFGQGFLSRFEEVQCNSKLLEGVTFIDTPGVLSGEKQRLHRAYNFIEVCSWFASRCDMIILFFDPFKLDISDEFRQVIESLQEHHDKIRVVLNKADQVSSQELMRVYGALLWSLAKVLRSPEVCKVYTGSFPETAPIPDHGSDEKDEASDESLGETFFLREEAQLLDDLAAVPSWTLNRKISEFAKRVRSLKTHIILMRHLRGKIPPLLFKQQVQTRLLNNIHHEFNEIKLNKYKLREYDVAPGDFPDPKQFRDACLTGDLDILAFPRLSDRQFNRHLRTLDNVLKLELANVSKMKEL